MAPPAWRLVWNCAGVPRRTWHPAVRRGLAAEAADPPATCPAWMWLPRPEGLANWPGGAVRPGRGCRADERVEFGARVVCLKERRGARVWAVG